MAIVLGVLGGILSAREITLYAQSQLCSVCSFYPILVRPDWPWWLWGWIAGAAAACGVATWATVRITAGVLSWVVTGYRDKDRVHRTAVFLGALSGLLTTILILFSAWDERWWGPYWLPQTYVWTAGVALACGVVVWLTIWGVVSLIASALSWVVTGFRSAPN